MGNVFPELKQYEDHIVDTIASEEKSFGRTLVNGIEKFKKAARDVKEKLSGQDAFLLWDTYGFPLDLTLLMAEERGLTVDVDGYNKAMNEARERSRNAQNKVDYVRRKLIAPNHTCTHMLNFALREVLGNHVDQKGSIVLLEKLRFDFSHAELDVYSKEAILADAKNVYGLRAVFGEVYPDPVRIVAIGRKVEDLLANPENKEWSSISVELCGGTHISNTREAESFALLSEEGIAKGIRRVTAVTTGSAFKAPELASALETEVNEASKAEGDLLEQKVTSLNGRVESAPIPTAKKTDLKAKISVLQNQVVKAKKKTAEENIQKAIKDVSEKAESVCSEGKGFCIARVSVGSDNAAMREAVVRVMEQKGIAIALKPLNGKGGGGKGGVLLKGRLEYSST
ncbi:hypothetical protein POM88_041789 [Heracleum sosnowskyi]|uniref:alanine--tRNA ligase n=1 Tax=Heracleum sosnowskyi TaxID=360622 RepID=A0AAD8MBN5_9APIA|nr:hypothetical protein POM88_041789 [Heracleum sosnowskyi]